MNYFQVTSRKCQKKCYNIHMYVRKKSQAVEVDIDTEFKESVRWNWILKVMINCCLDVSIYKSPSSNEANLTALNGLISKVCDMTFSHIVTTGEFNYPDIDWELWNAKEESSLSFIECVRDRPFNLKGVGDYGFLFRSEFCFRTRELEFFFQNSTLAYMTKTLNQIIFFSSTKIRIFFSATLGIRIFF